MWTIWNGEQSYEFGRPARFASNNYGTVRDATVAGGGIAVMTDFMAASSCGAGELVRVLPEWAVRPTDVHAVYPARQNMPPRLTLFLDHLGKALAPPPWAAQLAALASAAS